MVFGDYEAVLLRGVIRVTRTVFVAVLDLVNTRFLHVVIDLFCSLHSQAHEIDNS